MKRLEDHRRGGRKSARGVRSQLATASKPNLRDVSVAFSERGGLMATSILNRPRAVSMGHLPEGVQGAR